MNITLRYPLRYLVIGILTGFAILDWSLDVFFHETCGHSKSGTAGICPSSELS